MGTTSDKAVLTRKLGAVDYDPARYVAEISQRCVGGEEILAQRRSIQELSDDTNNLLKQNVYQNYTQFIETAKEISHLENDMYRLSSMITEQRKFLSGLLETSILGDLVPLSISTTSTTGEGDREEEPIKEEGDVAQLKREEEGRRSLVELMEKVEGGRELIDIPTRFLLYHGDLVEIDTSEHSAIHRVHIYLTNDCLIVATWLREKRGPVRFKLSSQYPLTAFAMVNVRDLAGVVNAWKLLISPEPRLFQCKDAQSKKEWLAAYEEARSLQKTGPDSAKSARSSSSSSAPPAKQGGGTSAANRIPKPGRGLPRGGAGNPFSDTESEPESRPEVVKEPELPEWLLELPDTLDVHIAQREFETALEILKEAEEDLNRRLETEAGAKSQQIKQLRTTADEKKKILIEVLRTELLVTPDKSMQGGPRTARRAVHLLTGLGREGEAKDLFLNHRTALLRHTVKNCRAEGNTVQYIHRLATGFFQQAAETIREFEKCFPSHKTSSSHLLSWLEQEIDWLVDRVDRQIFGTHAPLNSVCESVARLRSSAAKLHSLGVEIVFLLDSRLQPGIERVVCEARDKAIEAVKLRWGEDKWTRHTPASRQLLEKCLADLGECGVASTRSYLTPEGGALDLTSNSVSFGLAYLTLTHHLLLLYTPGTRHLINESLVSVLHAHLRHLDLAVRGEKTGDADKNLIMKNAAFLLDTVLTLAEHKYQEKTGSDIPKLGKLHSNYSWLKEGKGPVTKYTETNYV